MNIKKVLSGMAAFISITGAASHAGAQTTANGPYYATPSWDQTMAASTRFVLLTNFNSQAVLDRETGLVWWTTNLGYSGFNSSYADSLLFSGISNVGGRHGWRLPTLAELSSLADQNSTVPSSPFNIQSSSSNFWSTTSSGEPGTAAL